MTRRLALLLLAAALLYAYRHRLRVTALPDETYPDILTDPYLEVVAAA